MSGTHRIAVVLPYDPSLTETFIRAHIKLLPAAVTVIGWRPAIDGTPVLAVPRRIAYKLRRAVLKNGLGAELTAAYSTAFRRRGITAVLAEYGPTGTHVVEACSRLGIPLTVHFHGFDAFERSLLDQYSADYRRLFAARPRIVVVSEPMRQQLIELGANADRVFVNPCGVDCAAFTPAEPGANPPLVVAVGRLFEKKAPYLTLLAFADASRTVPDARLRMIGTGPLLDVCRDLACGLRIADRVQFLEAQPADVVKSELRQARVFVQHSVTARSGDSEGSPVSIAEAAATGLPVIATRHGGIPELVVDGRTGFLVDERDVATMAASMVRLLSDPALAGQMGAAARAHAVAHFDMSSRIARLRDIVCTGEPRAAAAEDASS